MREVIEAGDGPNLIEEEKIVEKQPVATCVPLLANEEFEMETGGYQSEAEEDEDNQETSGYHHEPEEEEDKQSEDPLHVDKSSGGNGVSKKRKASKELHSSKYVSSLIFQNYSSDLCNNNGSNCENCFSQLPGSFQKETFQNRQLQCSLP